MPTHLTLIKRRHRLIRAANLHLVELRRRTLAVRVVALHCARELLSAKAPFLPIPLPLPLPPPQPPYTHTHTTQHTFHDLPRIPTLPIRQDIIHLLALHLALVVVDDVARDQEHVRAGAAFEPVARRELAVRRVRVGEGGVLRGGGGEGGYGEDVGAGGADWLWGGSVGGIRQREGGEGGAYRRAFLFAGDGGCIVDDGNLR